MLISLAHAADGAPADMMGSLQQFLPLIVIFALFYFMMIRPQMKRAKEQKSMIESLQKGDEVVTAGGELGKVAKVDEAYVSLEIATNVVIHLQKSAITTLLPKGTIKDI
ncbi:MAG: preprotein translocase subunit YajC [Betaproteobacteria bacterium CG2_30_59_46]|nr:MAG: preprotein translocase subunit YajC [Betaproteobacteria bacterium CG2_30_59_46]PIQ13378.1 MAG: preprotein translocase subunit YajC [Hydrogenophilales bacterium CG18_big_fil_WC_8_21_14_2_50_58_12]PIX99574.1 MAG: preprotein translocase subunit YajC [Hydrogenophilales bacterium CG_4_10_14_3_um_filter_58_23]PJB04672.1 MAG: preprotein translocase subunit YajC [Hydrogenophilales bacterium CG_4_9_14_3_um_filter_59_35]